MSHLFSRIASALMVLSLLSWPGTALAHDSITVGEFTVEYGWVTEPPMAGQPNAIVVNVSHAEAHEAGAEATEESGHSHAGADVDVSQLKVEWLYGGETGILALQPVSEDKPGEFTAAFTPERPGKYTLRLSGLIDQTDVSVEVVPEEVLPASTSGAGNSLWLWGGLAVAALVVVGVGALALRRRK